MSYSPDSTPTMANVPFVALDNGGIMLPISLDMTLVSSRDDHYRSQRSVAPGPYHLLALPSEILLMILGFLDIADILRLRETCKQLRALASPWQVRAILGRGRLHSQLLRVCKTCLRYDPSRSRLLDSSPADPGYPLASCCLECAVKAGDPRIRMGKGIVMANLNVAWICRWCGRFTIGDGALKCEQIHHDCYSRIMSVYLTLGWIQFGLGIVAAALAWKYYRHEPSVFISTVVSRFCRTPLPPQ